MQQLHLRAHCGGSQHTTRPHHHNHNIRTNAVGRGLVTRTFDRTEQHIGPHFPTFVNASIHTRRCPDRHAHLNIPLTQVAITRSDHLPTTATIYTNPIMIPTPPRENWQTGTLSRKPYLTQTRLSCNQIISQHKHNDTLLPHHDVRHS